VVCSFGTACGKILDTALDSQESFAKGSALS
jgi:hypothetical protein